MKLRPFNILFAKVVSNDKIMALLEGNLSNVITVHRDMKEKIETFSDELKNLLNKLNINIKKNMLGDIINYQDVKIPLKVNEPETVGADRLCNISAAIKLYKYPAVVVDFGTATTYDVINDKGEFIGGVIAPGIETSAEYLFQKGALLKKIDLQFDINVTKDGDKEVANFRNLSISPQQKNTISLIQALQ